MPPKVTGEKALKAWIQKVERKQEVSMIRAIKKVAEEALRRSIALAPFDIGDMETTARTSTHLAKGKIRVEVAWGGRTGGVTPGRMVNYHILQHFGFYNPGEKTAAKPNTSDGKPGRLYLTRPLIKNRKRWVKQIAEETGRAVTGTITPGRGG